MFPLSTLSVLEIKGHDAGQFLHDQLSADIASIPAGGAGFGCLCNPAGRVLGLLLVSLQEESILAVCAADLAESLKAWLSRFIIRADVNIALRSDLAVSPAVHEESADGCIHIETDTGLGYTVWPGSKLQADSDETPERAWRIRELQAGIVWLGAASSAQFLPQMLGFETIGALNFKKGCFPGQEIIARTRYLGKLKRRPLLLHISDSAAAGIMEKITVISGDEQYSAVVVDRVQGSQQDQYLFTVVRAAEDLEVDRVVIREQSLALAGP